MFIIPRSRANEGDERRLGLDGSAAEERQELGGELGCRGGAPQRRAARISLARGAQRRRAGRARRTREELQEVRCVSETAARKTRISSSSSPRAFVAGHGMCVRVGEQCVNLLLVPLVCSSRPCTTSLDSLIWVE
jgi:hypothetical protein